MLPVSVRENVPTLCSEVGCCAIGLLAQLREVAIAITVFSRFCSIESEHKLVTWRRSDWQCPDIQRASLVQLRLGLRGWRSRLYLFACFHSSDPFWLSKPLQVQALCARIFALP